jgi:hypothetical protein
VESLFWKPGDAAGYYERDDKAHRHFLDSHFENYTAIVDAVTALAVEESHPVMARTDGWLLAEGKPDKDLVAKVKDKLQSAFRGAEFEVNVEEIGL